MRRLPECFWSTTTCTCISCIQLRTFVAADTRASKSRLESLKIRRYVIQKRRLTDFGDLKLRKIRSGVSLPNFFSSSSLYRLNDACSAVLLLATGGTAPMKKKMKSANCFRLWGFQERNVQLKIPLAPKRIGSYKSAQIYLFIFIVIGF